MVGAIKTGNEGRGITILTTDGGIGVDGRQLLALLASWEVGRLRIALLSSRRLALRSGTGKLTVCSRLGRIGRRRREGLHGRVSLGSRAGFLGRLQVDGTATA